MEWYAIFTICCFLAPLSLAAGTTSVEVTNVLTIISTASETTTVTVPRAKAVQSATDEQEGPPIPATGGSDGATAWLPTDTVVWWSSDASTIDTDYSTYTTDTDYPTITTACTTSYSYPSVIGSASWDPSFTDTSTPDYSDEVYTYISTQVWQQGSCESPVPGSSRVCSTSAMTSLYTLTDTLIYTKLTTDYTYYSYSSVYTCKSKTGVKECYYAPTEVPSVETETYVSLVNSDHRFPKPTSTSYYPWPTETYDPYTYSWDTYSPYPSETYDPYPSETYDPIPSPTETYDTYTYPTYTYSSSYHHHSYSDSVTYAPVETITTTICDCSDTDTPTSTATYYPHYTTYETVSIPCSTRSSSSSSSTASYDWGILTSQPWFTYTSGSSSGSSSSSCSSSRLSESWSILTLSTTSTADSPIGKSLTSSSSSSSSTRYPHSSPSSTHSHSYTSTSTYSIPSASVSTVPGNGAIGVTDGLRLKLIVGALAIVFTAMVGFA